MGPPGMGLSLCFAVGNSGGSVFGARVGSDGHILQTWAQYFFRYSGFFGTVCFGAGALLGMSFEAGT